MFKALGELSPEAWTAIFAGMGTLVLIIGTVIAARSLVIMANAASFESVREFLNQWAAARDDRYFVLREFNFSQTELPISFEVEQKVQNVVNVLNQAGLLLENGLLPPRLVFSICHSRVIRCFHRLDPYLSYHKGRIGGRYGRRLHRLVARARRYHDAFPQHRMTKIMIDTSEHQEPLVVYETDMRTRLTGAGQKTIWQVRRLFGMF